MNGIGLLNEKQLHAGLKLWYSRPGDQFESVVDGYVIDIVRDGLLLEIQTCGLSSIKAKLGRLVRSHRVRLIYPVTYEKWILRLAEDGTAALRKSPIVGRVEDLFRGMVSFPQLMSSPNFSLEVLMIQEEETRRYEPARSWRRKGWVTHERRLLEVVDQRSFEGPADWLELLPEGLDAFTAKDLAELLSIHEALAQKMAYCLRKAGAVALTGKRGRANLYGVAGHRNCRHLGYFCTDPDPPQ